MSLTGINFATYNPEDHGSLEDKTCPICHKKFEDEHVTVKQESFEGTAEKTNTFYHKACKSLANINKATTKVKIPKAKNSYCGAIKKTAVYVAAASILVAAGNLVYTCYQDPNFTQCLNNRYDQMVQDNQEFTESISQTALYGYEVLKNATVTWFS